MATIPEVAYKSLVAAVENTQPGLDGLVTALFPNVNVKNTQYIELDKRYNRARVATFVNPSAVADGTEKLGFERVPFKLPTIQDVQSITGEDLEMVSFGVEPYVTEQLSAIIGREVRRVVDDQRGLVRNKLGLMAIEEAFNGSITVIGKGENRVLDFGRPADLFVDVGASDPNQYWANSGAAVMSHVEDMLETMGQYGSTGNLLIGRPDVINDFLENLTVRERLDNRRTEIGGETFRNLFATRGMAYKGSIDGLEIWSYSGYYVKPDGTTDRAIPYDRVLIAATNNANVLQYGRAPIIPTLIGEMGSLVTVDSTNYQSILVPGRRDLEIEAIQTAAPLQADIGAFGVLKVRP